LPSNFQLVKGNLVGPDAYLPGADFSGATLTFDNLSAINFAGANFTGANLALSTFNNSNLTGADLTNTNVTDADLGYADLTGATLTGMHASPTFFGQPAATHLVHTTFTNANVTGAGLGSLNPPSTSGMVSGGIVGAPSTLPANWMLRGGWFVAPGASLKGADLSGLDLSGASLAGTILSGANLSGTAFGGATGVPSGGSSATYANTICPDLTVVTSPSTCVGHGF
jgi:uncharacterized protein YjbI with pentapeptide repeats